MKNVWSFGCSFSSGYLDVKREDTYSSLLAKDLGFKTKNFAEPGFCNERIFNTLTSKLDNIKTGDIVIYQFTFFNRVGLFKDKHNIHTYISSAGLPDFGIEHKMKEECYSGLSYDEVSALLDFTLIWQDRRFLFTYHNPINVLNFLKKRKKTKNFIIFLQKEENIKSDNVLCFPLENDLENTSWIDYLNESKLTIDSEFPEKYKNDGHPGFGAHVDIKNKILQELNKL